MSGFVRICLRVLLIGGEMIHGKQVFSKGKD